MALSEELPESRTAERGGESLPVVADVTHRADVYTRSGMRDRVVAYFAGEDMAAFEAEMTVKPPAGPGASG